VGETLELTFEKSLSAAAGKLLRFGELRLCETHFTTYQRFVATNC
jgi:hypothetical protein